MSSLKVYNPTDNAASLTLRDVIKANPPSLKRWALTVGAYEVQKKIVELIANVQKQLNIGKGLIISDVHGINQPATAASLIYSNFGHRMSIEDIGLAFNMGLMGEVGFKKIFDSFDITVMSDWIQNYLVYKQDRIDSIASSIKSEERLQSKKAEKSPLTDEEREQIRALKDKTLKMLEETRKKMAVQKQESQKRELTESEKYFVELMQQFDVMWKNQKYPTNSLNQRIIEFDCEKLTIEEYLKKNEIGNGE